YELELLRRGVAVADELDPPRSDLAQDVRTAWATFVVQAWIDGPDLRLAQLRVRAPERRADCDELTGRVIVRIRGQRIFGPTRVPLAPLRDVYVLRSVLADVQRIVIDSRRIVVEADLFENNAHWFSLTPKILRAAPTPRPG